MACLKFGSFTFQRVATHMGPTISKLPLCGQLYGLHTSLLMDPYFVYSTLIAAMRMIKTLADTVRHMLHVPLCTLCCMDMRMA